MDGKVRWCGEMEASVDLASVTREKGRFVGAVEVDCVVRGIGFQTNGMGWKELTKSDF